MQNKNRQFLNKFDKPIINWSIGLFFGIIIFLFLLNAFFLVYYKNKIYQGVYINKLTVGSLTKEEAIDLIKNIANWESYPIIIQHQNHQIQTSTAGLQQEINISDTVQRAINVGRAQNPFSNIKDIIKTKFQKIHLQTKTAYNKQQLINILNNFKQQVDTPNKPPSFVLNTSGSSNSLNFHQGVIGQEVNVLTTADQIIDKLNSLNLSINYLKEDQKSLKFTAIVEKTSYQLTDNQIVKLKERALCYVGKSILLKVDQSSSLLNDQQLIDLLSFPNNFDNNKTEKLMTDLTTKFNKLPKNAVFNYDSQIFTVTEFIPHQEGLKINTTDALQKIEKQMIEIEQSKDETKQYEIVLSTMKTTPKITLGKTNNLGINEKIGFGESYFRHSASNRIHNIDVASTKLNNTIIKPGEKFSLNKHLGEISITTGYKQGYVIKDNSTVLAPGGGVCQVSTTLFRTVLDTGLKITRRLPHSYRVRYYELNNDPGFDATVYAGETDLRFINDTKQNILIHTIMDRENYHLVMEIYGTSDGRTIEIVEYKKWGYTSPPPPVYVPTDTLASGQTKQIDWPKAGLSTSFRHIIKDAKANKISNTVYSSRYRAWPAKYLIGQ